MRKLLSVLSSTLQGELRGGLLLLALLATTSLWAEDFSVGGIYYNYLDGNNVAVTYRGNNYGYYYYSGAVTIPETVTYNGTTYSVTSIGNYAFTDCYSLTSITIPNSVTSIGWYAFSGCSSLTSINVDVNNPNYCSIDGVLFNKDKTTLIQYPIGNTRTEYTIPNSVTSIGEYAFRDCSSLTSITIGNSVTSIGRSAFYDCSSLTSITIPNSVTSIGDYALGYCSSLTSITIPNSVTSIGDYAFWYCSSLTSITIPNSVTSIGSSAFEGCSSLTSITIPKSVTSIGDYAFAYCSSLTTVICEAVEVPELGGYVFQDTPLSVATLYVPAESLDDYKAADQWKEFGTILPITEAPSDTENVNCQLSTINCQKLLRNGQIIILRDGVEYNIMGAEIQ